MDTNNPTIIPEASSVSLLSNLLTGAVLILWVTGSFYDCNIETLSVDTEIPSSQATVLEMATTSSGGLIMVFQCILGNRKCLV